MQNGAVRFLIEQLVETSVTRVCVLNRPNEPHAANTLIVPYVSVPNSHSLPCKHQVPFAAQHSLYTKRTQCTSYFFFCTVALRTHEGQAQGDAEGEGEGETEAQAEEDAQQLG
jgi:hypothetical protein